MKTTNGFRSFIIKTILLILFSLYFLFVFSQIAHASDSLPRPNAVRQMNEAKSSSLPRLLSFEGISSNKQVKLTWTFETTEGLDECIVERADKSGEFKPIAYFFMTEDIHIPNLHFTDNVSKRNTYSYRLRLTGKQGDSQYTKKLTLNTNKQDQKESLSYPVVIN
jgi:hypothetical protein